MILDLDMLVLRNEVDSDHKWGYQIRMVNEEGVEEGDKGYCGKLLVLENRERGGFHYHKQKKETFIILQGEVYLCIVAEDGTVPMEKNSVLVAGQQITIPPLERHFMQNWLDTPAIILEVSTHDDDEDTIYV